MVKVHGHKMKMFILRLYGCTLQRNVFLVVCRVLCVKVVGATSSKGPFYFNISTNTESTVCQKLGCIKYAVWITFVDCVCFKNLFCT